MFKEVFKNVRETCPLIHNITNYVTVNDCANILIACGASPIMADDPEEVVEITELCRGLNINIGTLNSRTVTSMLKAGIRANEIGHPIVLDPVGAGASKFRTETALKLLEQIKFAVIRGNVSEIKTLAMGKGTTMGVDAKASDKITKDNLDEYIAFAKSFAEKTGAVVAMTGPVDIVANNKTAYCIYNGTPEMASVTGTGCQLSAMVAAFVTANPDNILKSAAAATAAMGLAGEIAKSRMKDMDGNATYRNYIIDTVYNMSGEILEEGIRYEVR